MKLVPHWVSGSEFAGNGARRGEVFDPAKGIQSKEVAFADQSDIDAAVASASAAFPSWRDTSLAKRSAIMFRFRELLDAKKVSSPRSLPRSTARSYPMLSEK